MRKRVDLVFIAALVGACGGQPGESDPTAAGANPPSGPSGPSAPSDSSDEVQDVGDVGEPALPEGTLVPSGEVDEKPSPTAPVSPARPSADEHGVRVAGGETTDFGSGQVPTATCRASETIELSVEQARSAGIAGIDADLALFDRQYEAGFHSDICDDPCEADYEVSEDTRIRVSTEPLAVYRTPRQPIEGMALPEDCPDTFAYRAVVSVATEDGGLSGQFYARWSHPGGDGAEAQLTARAEPDLRNFDGSWLLPVALGRPYWGALRTSLSLSESGSSGRLSVVLNYTDNDVLAGYGSSPSGDGEVGVGGMWPAVGPGDDWVRVTPSGPEGAQPVSLSDYRASTVTPTCFVSLAISVQGPTDDPFYMFQAVDTEILIDGTPHSWTDPPFPGASGNMSATVGGPPVPWGVGRLPAGTLIEIDVRSTTSTGVPHAGIDVLPFRLATSCMEPGCTAHLEHRLTQYCKL